MIKGFAAIGILSLGLQPQLPQSPCATAEHHQFDFWIGDWEVVAPNGNVLGHSRITSTSKGCAIDENWSGAGGGNGRSLNTYDGRDKRWHQFWVGGDGTILRLAGTFADDVMTLADEANRIRFAKNADGTVRQTWEVSKDDGKTWQMTFDGKYVRSSR